MISVTSLGTGKTKRTLITVSTTSLIIEFLDYGATIRDIQYLGHSVVLNLKDTSLYCTTRPFINTTIGRVSGRISRGQLTIDGQPYQLTQNEGNHHLHGGQHGLDTCRFKYKIAEDEQQIVIVFSTILVNQLDGYPGNLSFEVQYTVLKKKAELLIQYTGWSDQKTPYDPTTHLYFNLAQDRRENIDRHWVKLPVEAVGLINSDDFLPTGELLTDGPIITACNQGIEVQHLLELIRQELTVSGLNHPLLLKRGAPLTISYEQTKVSIYGDRAMVVYTGDHFDGGWQTKAKIPIIPRAGLAVEIQKFPDLGRLPQFGQNILKPHQVQKNNTRIVFETI